MRGNKKLFVGIVGLVLVVFFCGFAAAGEKMTITGTINEDAQIETDEGKVYDIAESDKGAELSTMVGKKVNVTGVVEDSEGETLIEVETYAVVE